MRHFIRVTRVFESGRQCEMVINSDYIITAEKIVGGGSLLTLMDWPDNVILAESIEEITDLLCGSVGEETK